MVAAFKWEVGPLLRSRSAKGNPSRIKGPHPKIYSLDLDSQPVVLAIAGAGAENSFRAAQFLCRNFDLRGLATMGFAGGLVPELRLGDVILADRVIDEVTGQRFECQTDLLPIRFARQGGLLSASAVVSSSAQKIRLGNESGTIAVDMESAGVARAAILAGLPFCAIKSITDAAEQSLSIDFNACLREDKTMSAWAVARQGLTNSDAARDLWKLAWGARQAAGSLAAAMVGVNRLAIPATK